MKVWMKLRFSTSLSARPYDTVGRSKSTARCGREGSLRFMLGSSLSGTTVPGQGMMRFHSFSMSNEKYQQHWSVEGTRVRE